MELPALPSLPSPSASGINMLARARRRRQEPDTEPSDSMLRRIGSSTLGGISRLGNVLDLPASMARDVISTLTGDFRNPFDQLLSPTTDENRVSGRDFNRRLGLAGSEDNYGNFWGGFATEVLLDPLTYMTFGASALTKSGRLAKKAGILDQAIASRIGTKAQPKLLDSGFRGMMGLTRRGTGDIIGKRTARINTSLSDAIEAATSAGIGDAAERAAKAAANSGDNLADLLNMPLGKSIGFGLPFTSIKGGVNIPSLSRGMDLLSNSIAFSRPGAHLTALFDKTAKGATAEEGIKAARLQHAEGANAVTKIREELASTFRSVDDAMGASTFDDQLAMTEYLEGLRTDLPATAAGAKESLDKLGGMMRQIKDMEESLGVDTQELQSLVSNYYPRMRQFIDETEKTAVRNRRRLENNRGLNAFSTTHSGHMARTLQHIDTATVNRMSIDPDFAGRLSTKEGRSKVNSDWLEEQFYKKYRDKMPSEAIRKHQIEVLSEHLAGAHQAKAKAAIEGLRDARTPQEINDAIEAAVEDFPTLNTLDWAQKADEADRALFRSITHRDIRSVEEGLPMFVVNPAEAAVRRLEHGADAVASASAIHRLLADHAQLIDRTTFNSPDFVSVTEVMDATRLNRANAEQAFLSRVAPDIAEQARKYAEDAAQDGAIPTGATTAALMVPRQIADQATRLYKAYQTEEAASAVLRAVNQVTNLFKTGVTSIFPGFHARNFISGMFQNWIGDALDAKDIAKIHGVMRGREIQGIADQIPMFRGMTDAEATKKFAELAYSHGVTGSQGWVSDIAGDALTRQPMSRNLPGEARVFASLREAKSGDAGIIGKTIGIWNTPGVRGDGKELNLLTAAGRDIGNYVEGFNRLTPFYTLLKRGWDPQAAAKHVKMLQVDYTNLSNFEKNFMKVAFPFYSFTRGVIPATIEAIATTPGGRLGKSVRAARLAKPKDAILPEYVADTAAIPTPWGAKNPEDDSYITGFGLMAEDPISFLGGPRSTLLEMASRANPLIKAPLEWMTGQSFFQKTPFGGRSLEDMDPTIGRIMANATGQKEAQPFGGLLGNQAGRAAEFVVGNSPLSRFMTTTRMLTDPRKSGGDKLMNFLTGVRQSNVSEANRDAIVREKASELLKMNGGKEFVRTYFPEATAEDLSPDQAQQVEELQTLLRVMANRAKARKGQLAN